VTGKQKANRGATFEDEFRRSCGQLEVKEIIREPAGHDYTLVYEDFSVGIELKCKISPQIHMGALSTYQKLTLAKLAPLAFVVVNWRTKNENRAFVVPFDKLRNARKLDASTFPELPRKKLRGAYGWDLSLLEEAILDAYTHAVNATGEQCADTAPESYTG